MVPDQFLEKATQSKLEMLFQSLDMKTKVSLMGQRHSVLCWTHEKPPIWGESSVHPLYGMGFMFLLLLKSMVEGELQGDIYRTL